ncbi:hypothetical protein KCP73_16560 [Salmonella enterica subsp. enterica]|nr:hypothetical protein KCP73_16560 [Salmonella enterica subsp. enterica]
MPSELGGGRFSAAAWLTNGAAPNSNAPPEAALIKSSVRGYSPREVSVIFLLLTLIRMPPSHDRQTRPTSPPTDEQRLEIAAFFHIIDVRFLL